MRASLGAAALFAGLLLISQDSAADERFAVPAADAVARSEAEVREIFKEEYAKAKAADRLALARKLFEQAEETADDLVSKFVLLREARDVAAKAGDPAIAFKAAATLSKAFQIGTGAAHAPIADILVTTAVGTPAQRVVADSLVAAAAQARTEGDFNSTLTLLKAAELAARKSQNLALTGSIRGKLKEAETLKADAADLDRHLVTLEKSPDDPAANLAVGRYLCMVRGDWKGGVPLLAKSGDVQLKGAALKDQAAAAGAAAEQLTAGDAWYDLGAAESSFQRAAQGRAYHWYQLAAPAAAGLTKVKLDTRLKELQAIAAEQGGMAGRFALIRKALSGKAIRRWPKLGRDNENLYEELPAAPSILIGFHYAPGGERRNPELIQAIYLTPTGEVTGKAFGATRNPGEMMQTTKAKPGYAIGAIYTRTGAWLDAIQPIYMRMTDKGLDPKDSYEGPYLGGQGGSDEGTIGGDGQFIVGIHGNVTSFGDSRNLATISLFGLGAPGGMGVQPLTPPVSTKKPPVTKKLPLRP